jgi:RNA polymerase sigma-70 factor (ECF subfamily)
MELTPEILALRPYLFRIAYDMLGVVEDAEDIVQDAFEKWITVNDVQTPKAYLARIVVNRSIDRLNELKKQRESYTGPWLPEPFITLDPDPAPTAEYGLLFLLERLNAVERAVFILRESFSEEYSTIAELMDLSADNCRQLLHRAHEKLGRSKKFPVDPARQRALTEAFLVALHSHDRAALDDLLLADVQLFSDGGGKRAAALRPLHGIGKVLKFLFGVAQLPENSNDDFEYRPAFANGLPAALIYRRSTGELDGLQYVENDGGQITRLLYVRNPEKLRVR